MCMNIVIKSIKISELAQRKRVGLITQRSEDRNLDSLVVVPVLVVRSYHGGDTGSHSNSVVKHHWARLVLRWGTTWEPHVLNNTTAPTRCCTLGPAPAGTHTQNEARGTQTRRPNAPQKIPLNTSRSNPKPPPDTKQAQICV